MYALTEVSIPAVECPTANGEGLIHSEPMTRSTIQIQILLPYILFLFFTWEIHPFPTFRENHQGSGCCDSGKWVPVVLYPSQ